MLLTVNVATLKNRDQSFVNHLKNIAPDWCEINTDFGDDCLGDKRQRMLENSNGKYVCVIDDDDEISEYYFDKILEGINKKVDVVCIALDRYEDGIFEKAYHFGAKNPNTTQPYVSHFCPVKKEIALLSGYRSIGMGEDLDFAVGLADHLKTAHYISKPIYFQKYVTREKEYNLFCSFIDYAPRISLGNDILV